MSHLLRCEVLTVMNIEIVVFVDVIPCICLDGYQSLGGTSCLHLQGYEMWRH
jgi:hypothetical protein